MATILNASIVNRRLFISFSDGTLEVGLPEESVQDFLDLIPLMIEAEVTERVLDRDKNFFKLSFANDEKKIHKFFAFTFDKATDEFNWSAFNANGTF